MPDKSWIIYLSEECHILVFLHTDGALVLGFAVVLVATIKGEQVCITRYDTAHGQAHRDVLGKNSGLIEKQWLLNLTFNDAFDYALMDIKENYGDYLQEYIKN